MARRGASLSQVTILGAPVLPPRSILYTAMNDFTISTHTIYRFLLSTGQILFILLFHLLDDLRRRLTDPPNPSPSELITLFLHAISLPT